MQGNGSGESGGQLQQLLKVLTDLREAAEAARREGDLTRARELGERIGESERRLDALLRARHGLGGLD
ncbi:hypothetical protein SAMN05660831_01505 [Thiohalospira halophila DSM 15071]|jgi:hypothetical protein|uniref:Uncharacterized protein n=1 Tax=Thiohalospira halophila DSM 15071 TaxID=1123397 RepID=A0A1I1RM51_9GAMM|nr:hypothetical protein [Thiohalospira halophila]SFD35395.1 hypothetical protein SAMN05660831_01505 [Thiohalospira halophila DSM 15071]